MDTGLRAVKLLRGDVYITKTNPGKYTDEFKDEAVILPAEQGFKITEDAGYLDKHDSLLRRWIIGRFPDRKVGKSGSIKFQAELKTAQA